MNKLSNTSLDFTPRKMHIKMQTLWSLKQSSWSKDLLTVQNPICEGEVLQAMLYFTSNYQLKLMQKIVCFWRFRLQKDRVHDTSYRLLTLGRWGKNQLDHSSLKKNYCLIIGNSLPVGSYNFTKLKCYAGLVRNVDMFPAWIYLSLPFQSQSCHTSDGEWLIFSGMSFQLKICFFTQSLLTRICGKCLFHSFFGSPTCGNASRQWSDIS